MTETFAGGHGAPSTQDLAFYAPDQKRNVIGEFAKEDGEGEETDWEKAKGMSQAQWDKLSDAQRASLLAAVYVADADKKPGASAALAKLRGWVNTKKGKGGGSGGGGGGKSAADKKKREAETAQKKKDADAKRAQRAKDARRVRPDSVNSSHRDGHILGESEDGKTRMRWDKAHSTYVVENRDGKGWKESRRLKPEQAYNELAKANANWFRPKVQPYLKNGDDKSSAPSSSTSPGRKQTATGPAPRSGSRRTTPTPTRRRQSDGPPVNSGRVNLTAAAEVHTGAMIALVPREDLTASIAVDGGEEPEQLHMTEVYLGQSADISDDEKFQIIDAMSDFAARQLPVEGDAFSVNLFNPPGSAQSDGKDRDACVTLGISGHDVAAFHDELVDALERAGVQYPDQHEPRVPHVTLVYTDDADLSYFTDKTGPIVFDTLRIAFGGETFDIPLGEGRDEDITAATVAFYSPTQKRDGEGQWTDGPGGGGGAVKDAVKKLAKPTDSASLWKNRKDYVGKVVAVRYSKGEEYSRLIVIEGPKGPIIRPEIKDSKGGWSGEDDGYRDIKSAKKLREETEDAKSWMKHDFVEPEDAHPADKMPSAMPKAKADEPKYVEPEEPVSDEPGHDPSEWDNLPESEAPDGWADGGSDPEVMPKERRETKQWSELQRSAIEGYTVDATTYNSDLRDRNGKKPPKETYDHLGTDLGEAIPAIDSAMYPVPREMTVFRQATLKAFGVSSIEELKSLDGQVLKDFGYLSTSVNFAQNLTNGSHKANIHMKIEVPKGKKAAYVADVSAYPEQNELLLARGSKLKIQSIEYKNGRAFVTMKVV